MHICKVLWWFNPTMLFSLDCLLFHKDLLTDVRHVSDQLVVCHVTLKQLGCLLYSQRFGLCLVAGMKRHKVLRRLLK